LIALLFLELTDIIFAVDSVPAIFAITKEPLIVFTSNIFAILGLRAMYFMLAGAVDKFYLLKYGLAVVLIFVGLKMVWLNDAFGGKFPITWSLGFITNFFDDCLTQISELMRLMTVKERDEIRTKILSRCRSVAETAGGKSRMDVNHHISREETELLAELQEILK
jgi:predicted tellurium resistance membrane protein TerC